MTINSNLQKSPLPPGSFGLPLIGETINFLFDRNFSSKKIAQHGNIYKTSIFGNPTVIMIGAQANEFLFRHENEYVVSTWPKTTKVLLGQTSLAVKNGDFHTSRRKILAQAFQPRVLASYLPTIEAITANYLQKWAKLGELTWYPELRNYTFDIAAKLFVGVDNGSQTRLCNLFEEWCQGLFSIPVNLPWTKFGKALKCRENMLQEIEAIVKQRQAGDNTHSDALSLLLKAEDENGDRLTLEELKDQVLLLLFAGHETLTSAIASFCLLTAQHPQVLAKIRQEQQKLNYQVPFNIEQLKEMTYLEQVLKEVLRLIPPVGGGFRKAIEDFSFQGYHIPKGWTVQYQILQTHQDETIYHDKDKFDPDRFSPENSLEKQKKFSFVPFGGGLRECLGKEFARLEMRVFASLLSHNYQWELLPNQDLTMAIIPTPHPKDGLKVKFSTLLQN
ncbi:cytochrome P450 [Geminocystis sp. NIES-3708]|uniref:cytochrome P450 n=1 Tax=Geminocystis sp. NIES-3708 TaxID=1615909 RepID=UPI0005FC77CF|nr:cytochrome P450 [Geminocystis sp. NIES-3708]BAQ61940.1 cytochrome P450 [Geminocystis sp. NIES-3708]